jgi:hypothetical protein
MKIGITKIGFSQITLTDISTGQIGTAEINLSESATFENNAGKIGMHCRIFPAHDIPLDTAFLQDGLMTRISSQNRPNRQSKRKSGTDDNTK